MISSSVNNNNASPASTPVAKCSMADFLNKLPDELKARVAQALQDECIDDDETLHDINYEMWKSMGFKVGEVVKIEKAMRA